jgi:hypothetical protein
MSRDAFRPRAPEGTRIIGHMRPFVKVERYRIGKFDAREPGLKRRIESRQRAERPVDMEPETIFLRSERGFPGDRWRPY